MSRSILGYLHDTSNAAAYSGSSGSAVANQIIVAFVSVTDTVAPGTMAVANNPWGIANANWAKVQEFLKADGLTRMACFVGTTGGSNPGADTFDVALSGGGGNATGCNMFVLGYTDDSGTAPTYVQSSTDEAGSAGNPLHDTLGALGAASWVAASFVINRSPPAGTPASGWAEPSADADGGYTSPASGMWTIDSNGVTSDNTPSGTWSAGIACSIAVEIAQPAGATPKTASDTVGLEANAGTTDLVSTSSRTDTAGLATVEGTTVLLSTLDRPDTVALAAVEGTTGLVVGVGRADALDVALVEGATTVVNTIGRSDTVAVATVEGPTGLAAASDRADTVALSTTEVSTNASTLGRADTVALATVEVSATSVVLLTVDTAALAIAEASSVMAGLSRADAIDLTAVAGATTLEGESTRADTVAVATSDVSALMAALAPRADTVAVETNAGATGIAVVITTSGDTVALSMVEGATTLQAALVRTEALDVATVMGSSVLGVIDRTDALALAALEGVTGIAVVQSRTDTIALATVETTPSGMAIVLERADTLDVDLDELAIIASTLARADSLDLEASEGPAVVVQRTPGGHTLIMVIG